MNKGRWLFFSLLALAPVLAVADSAYVTEQVYVELRSEAHYESPVVHRVLAGTPLETTEQRGDFMLVRDASGRQGWIESRELTLEPPARVRAEQLDRELEAARAELSRAQEQLRQAHTVMAEDSAAEKARVTAQAQFKRENAQLHAKLGQTEKLLAKSQAELEQAQAALAQEAATTKELASQLATYVSAKNRPAPSDPTQPLAAGVGSGDEPLPAGAAEEPDPYARFLRLLRSVDVLWAGISFAMLLIGFGVGVIWLRERHRRKLGGMYLRI
jgi:SH3 domain protein